MSKLFFFLLLCITVAGQSGGCTIKNLKQEQEQRKVAFSKMYKPGKTIEDITFGNTNLYSFASDKILIFFWKTDCPFCKNLLEEIKLILNNNTSDKVQVIGVSLNERKEAWEDHDFVKAKYPNLLNIHEDKGYFGNLAVKYHIYATPTMILLNKDHHFIKLPKNKEELRLMFKI